MFFDVDFTNEYNPGTGLVIISKGIPGPIVLGEPSINPPDYPILWN